MIRLGLIGTVGGGVVKVRGGSPLSVKLRSASGPDLERRVGQALFAAGNQIEVEAALSITRGAVSGANHVPSRPGEPPNADTHQLDRSIETVQITPLKVEVSANAPHAVPLEFGTSKMAARPFMRPAAEKVRPKVLELVQLAQRRAKGRA